MSAAGPKSPRKTRSGSGRVPTSPVPAPAAAGGRAGGSSPSAAGNRDSAPETPVAVAAGGVAAGASDGDSVAHTPAAEMVSRKPFIPRSPIVARLQAVTSQDRLRRFALMEFQSLVHQVPAHMYIFPHPEDCTQWHGVFFPVNDHYHGGVFVFTLRFQARWPEEPPIVEFGVPVFHPFVSDTPPYRLVLDKALEGGWTNKTTMLQVVKAIKGLFFPSGFSLSLAGVETVNRKAAEIYATNRKSFNNLAAQCAQETVKMLQRRELVLGNATLRLGTDDEVQDLGKRLGTSGLPAAVRPLKQVTH